LIPVSRSATVDGVPDFVNLYDYDGQDRLVALTQTGQGGSAPSRYERPDEGDDPAVSIAYVGVPTT
jgi:hypothetical protein